MDFLVAYNSERLAHFGLCGKIITVETVIYFKDIYIFHLNVFSNLNFYIQKLE